MKKLYLLLAIIATIIPGLSHATHLIGGNMSYEDLGPSSTFPGNREYRIRFQAYMDCNSVNWPNTFPEPNIDIGIYEGSISDVDVDFVSTATMDTVSVGVVDPNLPPGCSFSTSNCVALVEYSTIVSLAPSNEGYHILYDRCCRPGGIVNLDNSGAQALTYKVFIPSDGSGNLLPNSSAAFNDTLVSFICEDDTTFIPNSAIDPDGDSLVYSLEQPYDGNTSSASPGPAYSSPNFDPYPNPPNLVTWGPGFSTNQIFGNTGFQSINPTTGTTQFGASNPGNYAAAVEIKEYRNGQLISVTRRDIQLLVVQCPPNPNPAQDTSNLDTTALSPVEYQVTAGDSFCIDLDYFDEEGDSLFMSATGNIFDPNLVSPSANILAPLSGDSAITTQLCWQTTCAQGRNAPYTFNVAVRDNGCPPKTFTQNYAIDVQPFEINQEIQGPELVCSGQSQETYSLPNIQGATYNWTVNGGNIISGSGTNQLEINWTGNTGSVQATVTSNNSCVVNKSLSVIITQVFANAGQDTSICFGDTTTIGGGSLGVGETVSWTPTAGLSNPNVLFPDASPTGSTDYVLEITDSNSCSTTDTVTVIINRPDTLDLSTNYFLCPGDTLELNPDVPSFIWTSNYFISNQTTIPTRFFPPNDTTYYVDYIDTNGCAATDSINVVTQPEVPTNAGPDRAICVGGSILLGANPTSPPFTDYAWSPNVNMNDSTLSNPLVNPSNSQSYIVNTTNDTCTGSDTVNLVVNPNPTLSTSPDTFACEGDTTQIFAFGTGDFVWNNGDLLSDSTSASPFVLNPTDTTFVVTLTDANGCQSTDSIDVRVQELPTINPGSDRYICRTRGAMLGANPTGPAGSNYQWSSGSEIDNDTSANPVVFPDQTTNYSVTVTDSLGCIDSASVTLSVMSLFGGFDTIVCRGSEVPMTFNVSDGIQPLNYSISPGQDIEYNQGDSIVARITNPRNYEIRVTDSLGCTDTTLVEVQTYQEPEAEFNYTIIPGCEQPKIEVENFSANTENSKWLLNGEPYTTDELRSLDFAYGLELDLVLIAESPNGCIDTTAVNISPKYLETLLNLKTPNVITPNNDGVNDYFEVKSNGNVVNCLSLRVYNRWGALIFENEGGFASWNGKNFSGEDVAVGTYYYILEIQNITKKGSVTLYR